jgi:hypothetical protein
MAIKNNLNFMIYDFAYRAKGRLLNLAPTHLVPRRLDLSSKMQIAITTYVDRYDLYFKPLFFSLRKLFPEINILVAVNGFPDNDVQMQYLDRFRSEICDIMPLNCLFLLHDKPVGLTRMWNELLSLSEYNATLILNDDLKIYPWFKSWINQTCISSGLTLINGTWSHFFICKEVLDLVGWFDEDFHGIGFEDMDYTARCALKGIKIGNLRCPHIIHHDHQPLRTSFDNKSSTLWGPKYSSINHDAFFQKWEITEDPAGIYIKQLNASVVPTTILSNISSPINLTFNGNICYPDR